MAHEAAKELAKEPGAEVLALKRTGSGWCTLMHPVTFHPDETYFVSSNTRAILSGGTGLTDDQLMQHWRDLYDSGSVDIHRDACVNEEGRYLVGGDAVPRAKTFGEIECIKDAIADQMRHFDALKNIDPYADLYRILNEAFEQASQGKGARRHGSGLPFDRQPMQTISDMLGSPDFMAGQAIKKIREARGLKGGQAKRAELLGAINYVAGMILWYERQAGGGDD